MVSPEERKLRVDLAACYRLIALFGWDDLIFTHVSVKLPGKESFLINPYGMFFEEITASSLVEVDAAGTKISESNWPVNPAGFVIHSAIHAVRHDVVCVLHTHTPAGVAVSAQRDGLLPISQQATIALASLGFNSAGDNNALILKNHGLLTVGASVGDAFLQMYNLQRACEVQLLAQSGGRGLIDVDSRIVGGVKANVAAVTKGLGGDLVWPGLLRRLDRQNPGYAD